MHDIQANAAIQHDYALIVGIDHYEGPGLPRLSGALNDARYFRNWLVRNGRVRSENIRFFPSREADFTPNKDMIESAFLQFLRAWQASGVRGNRLYMYFSGHGIEPLGFTEDNRVLVLMANAASDLLNRNVAPLRAARLFRCSAFHEVLLFADCCRTDSRERVSVDFGFEPKLNSVQGLAQGKLLFGLATRWASEAREAHLPDENGEGSVPRGVFTHGLLRALECAEDPAVPGFVTGNSLKEYLDRQAPLANPPRIEGDLDIVVGRSLEPGVVVTVTVTPPHTSFDVRHGKDFARITLQRTQVSLREFTVRLTRGMYLIGPPQTDGFPSGKIVHVQGDRPLHVDI